MMSRTVPSWLPDWRKPEQYPNPQTTSRREWAWQFLRRNPQYQDAYRQLHQHPQARNRAWVDRGVIELKHEGVLDPTIDRSFYDEFEMLFKEVKVRFQLARSLYDPSVDFWEIGSSNLPEYRINLGPPRYTNSQIEHLTTQVPVLIDLTLPIDPQLATIKAALEPTRKMYFKSKRPAPQPEKLPVYLRILDARVCGISYAEIGDQIYPYLPNDYPDNARKGQAQAAAKAARGYRDDHYRLLYSASPDSRYAPIVEG